MKGLLDNNKTDAKYYKSYIGNRTEIMCDIYLENAERRPVSYSVLIFQFNICEAGRPRLGSQ